MSAARERALMGLTLAGLPLLLYFAVLRPSLRRMARLHERIRTAEAQANPVQPFTPVGREERAFLEDPEAAWRTRIPRIDTDPARLAHVNRVVGAVSAALKDAGVTVAAMRASWDPVKADFTLPAALDRTAQPWKPTADEPEYQMAAWVLEVEISGPTEDLFKALAAVPAMGPLMEPVGLTWGGAGPDDHRQVLLLRNYYLKP